jgi:putative Mg2+ transporter-C (MgtC) family protein
MPLDAQTLQTDLAILVRLAVALALGAAIGWEREAAGKAAGLRTHMLVGVASALFVALGDAMIEHFTAQAQRMGRPEEAVFRSDPIRIIEAVVTGISFLGAGMIFVSHGRERVEGLTTAAAIWATAAVGIAVGLERYLLALGSTVLILVVLRVVPALPIERDQQGSRA